VKTRVPRVNVASVSVAGTTVSSRFPRPDAPGRRGINVTYHYGFFSYYLLASFAVLI
jgi:hypothetical protein